MATITTTIKEPKTFQQIQDQKRELDKEEALETLNNNIAKLIKTINDKSEKKISDDERQLKANQLALSKLQLRRAQLGLAKDEKSYSDYSVKYNSTHGIGSSIGVSQNSRDNATAIALSAVTAGALNPVIVKDVLLPPLKMMTRAVTGVTKALISGFSGRRISGKSSSAVESYEKNRLHKKLDDIISAIKNKPKQTYKEQQKKEGFFSKLLGALAGLAGTVGRLLINALKGALGAYLAIKLGEKIGPWLKKGLSNVIGENAAEVLVNTMQAYIPSMAAGYMIAGWRGAVAGLAFHLLGEAIGVIKTKVNGPTLMDVGTNEVNKLLKPFGLKLTTEQFKGVVGGFALAGPKGALLGFALGTEIVQKAIERIKNHDYGGILEDIDDSISNLKKGTPFENVSNDAIKGAIAGGIIGGKFFGFKGLILGAMLGAAGGLVWNKYKNANDPSKFGLNTQFDPSKLDWNIAGLDKTWSQFREEAKTDLKKNGIKLTTRNIDERAARLAKMQLEREGKSNEAKDFSSGIFDFVIGKIKEHPLEIAGIAGLTVAITGMSDLLKAPADGLISLTKGILTSLKGNAGLIAGIAGLTAIVTKIWEGHTKTSEYIEKRSKTDKEFAALPTSKQLEIASTETIGKSAYEHWNKVTDANASITERLVAGFQLAGDSLNALGNEYEQIGAKVAETITGDDGFAVGKTNIEKFRLANSFINNNNLSEDEEKRYRKLRKKYFTKAVNSFRNNVLIRDGYLEDNILGVSSDTEVANAVLDLTKRFQLNGEEALHLSRFLRNEKDFDRETVIKVIEEITNKRGNEIIEKMNQETEEENNQCVRDNNNKIDENTKILIDLNKNISQLNQTLIPSQNDLGYTPYPLTPTNPAMTQNGPVQ